MSVGGSYLAFQLRGALPSFRIYKDSILTDALAAGWPGLINIRKMELNTGQAPAAMAGARARTP